MPHRRLHSLLCATILVVSSGPALATGPIQSACELSPEGATVDCACAQNVADEHLSSEDQAIAAEYISGRANPMLLVQERGEAGAQEFIEKFSAWGTASSEACGSPNVNPPRG